MGGFLSFACVDLMKPTRAQILQRRKGRIASAEARHSARLKLLKDIENYDLFNGICRLYPPQQWDPKNFKAGDKPMLGDRKERNRISSENHRRRVKLMHKVLHDRLEVLERALEPIYMPTLDFEFPFSEASLPTGEAPNEGQCDILGYSHGKWEFTGGRPVLKKI